MNPERWKRVKELYARSLELQPEERAQFLAQTCGADAELRREVERLLESGDPGDFLETPAAAEIPQASWMGPGSLLGDFKLLEEIGRGGMGVVYRARQLSLGREVAVKVLPWHRTLEERHVERFRREAHAAARLSHPGIVPIHFVGEEGGNHYFAMDFVVGRSLDQELDLVRRLTQGEGPFETILPAFSTKGYVASVVKLAASVASALHYAHGNGVVHRDVKPHNLLLDKAGRVQVVDFGLAKVEELGSISRSGEIAGTPHYMSPEQALARRVKVDHRTDIFSLGVVLYETLTLHRPFEGKTSHEVLYEISFHEPRKIREHNPRVPRDLETIVIKALEKTPEDRFQSASELGDDLNRFLNHEAITAQRPHPITRFRRHVERRRSWYLPGAIAALLLVGGVLFAARLLAQRQVREHLRPLRGVVEAQDLGIWPIDALVVALEKARTLQSQGVDDGLIANAIEKIENVAHELKRLGLERIRLGLASPPDAPLAHRPPPSDRDFFAGLRLLEEAKLLLPGDAELDSWTDLRNTYPTLGFPLDHGLEGADVYVQSIDWKSYRLASRERLGRLPFDARQPIEPGLYRITIVKDEGPELEVAELTRALDLRGRFYELRPWLRPTSSVTQGMIHVPAGGYRVGDPTSPSFPQIYERTAELEEFWIDRTEVTNAEFRRFVLETGYRAPELWEGRYEGAWDDLPVVVDFAGAFAYAEWAGKRLPTYDEWDAAARGPEAFKFPWGNEGEQLADRAIIGRAPMGYFIELPGYLRGAQPVGSAPQDRSPFGLLDVLGNVQEWTETPWYGVDDQGEPHLELGTRIIKGQAWDCPAAEHRNLYGVDKAPVQAGAAGFRCAKSAWTPKRS